MNFSNVHYTSVPPQNNGRHIVNGGSVVHHRTFALPPELSTAFTRQPQCVPQSRPSAPNNNGSQSHIQIQQRQRFRSIYSVPVNNHINPVNNNAIATAVCNNLQNLVVPVVGTHNNNAAINMVLQCEEDINKSMARQKLAVMNLMGENKICNNQLLLQQSKVAELERTIEEQKNSLRQAETQLKTLRLENDKQVEDSCRQFDDLHATLAVRKKRIHILECKLTEVNASLMEQQTQVASLTKSNVEKDQDNQKMRELVAKQEKELEKSQQEYKAASLRFQTKEKEFHQSDASLKEKVAHLEQREAHLSEELVKEKAERMQLRLELEKVQATSNKIMIWTMKCQNKLQENLATQNNFQLLNELKDIIDGDRAVVSVEIPSGAMVDSGLEATASTSSTSPENFKRKVDDLQSSFDESLSKMDKRLKVVEENVKLTDKSKSVVNIMDHNKSSNVHNDHSYISTSLDSRNQNDSDSDTERLYIFERIMDKDREIDTRMFD